MVTLVVAVLRLSESLSHSDVSGPRCSDNGRHHQTLSLSTIWSCVLTKADSLNIKAGMFLSTCHISKPQDVFPCTWQYPHCRPSHWTCGDGCHRNLPLQEASGSKDERHLFPAWASCAMVLGICATLCKVRSTTCLTPQLTRLVCSTASHAHSQTWLRSTALWSQYVKVATSS